MVTRAACPVYTLPEKLFVKFRFPFATSPLLCNFPGKLTQDFVVKIGGDVEGTANVENKMNHDVKDH